MSNSIMHKTNTFYKELPKWSRLAVIGGLAIVGIILAIPLIKGLKSIFKGLGSIGGVAGDILSAPGNIIDAMNKDFDNSVNKAVKTQIDFWVRTHNYNPTDPQDAYRMTSLDKFIEMKIITKDEKKMWVTIWKTKKVFSKEDQRIIDMVS